MQIKLTAQINLKSEPTGFKEIFQSLVFIRLRKPLRNPLGTISNFVNR